MTKLISYYEKTHFFLLCLLVLFPIAPRGVHSMIMVCISLLALIFFFVEGRKLWNKTRALYLVALGSLSVLYIISLVHFEDISSGGKMVVRTLPILLLPFTFLNRSETGLMPRQFLTILWLYIAAILALVLYLQLVFFQEIHESTLNAWELRHHIEQKTDIHGTYLAMWIGFAILVVVWMLFKKIHQSWIKIVGVLAVGYFFYWLYIIGARMPMLSTVVATGWLLLALLKVPVKVIVGIYVLLLGLAAGVLRQPILTKFQELRNYQDAIPAGEYASTNPLISNENIRSVIYYCAQKSIKENPIFGYGVGTVDGQLQQCYNSEFSHTDLFTRFHFNAHSQYLQMILATGFLGILFYSISIVYWMRRSTFVMYIPFVVFMLLCFVFENILNRHDGIVFFSLFNTLLFFQGKNARKM